MAKHNKSRKLVKRNKKDVLHSNYGPLCALGAWLQSDQMFAPIHEKVHIAQKKVTYSPTDKLVFIVLSMLSGAQNVYEINTTLRPDRALLLALGYAHCADQSVIQRTLKTANADNVKELDTAIQAIFDQHNRVRTHLAKAIDEQKVLTMDMDLSGQPCSKKAQGASKGYFSNRHTRYGRQLARVMCPLSQEIITESLHPGHTLSMQAFKHMVKAMEQRLHMRENKQARSHIRLRLDAGFGTDACINYALFRGYHLLCKVYARKRVGKLVKSVTTWQDIPTTSCGLPRQAGWVEKPHRYGRKIRQLAVRTPSRKGGYVYDVLVTTDLTAGLESLIDDYEARAGLPESSFCQDNQGLAHRKRRTRSFIAQQILMLLTQLAHNIICWVKHNLTTRLIEEQAVSEGIEKPPFIEAWGIKRIIRQLFQINAWVTVSKQKVRHIRLNPLYPRIHLINKAFQALMKPLHIHVSLHQI